MSGIAECGKELWMGVDLLNVRGLQELDQQAPEPDRFLRQVAPCGIGARRIDPALGIDGVGGR